MSATDKEKSILEWEDQANSTVKYTPPPSTVGEIDGIEMHRYEAPLADRIYKIYSVECGRQLTLFKAEVVLTEANSLGSSYWACEKHNHWYGFRNVASNKYLGHNGKEPGKMRCTADRHQLWERLVVTPHMTSPGAYSLLTEYYTHLKSVGKGPDSKNGHVHRVLEENNPGMAWIFVEVPNT